MKYDEKGRELPDDTPVSVPVGFKRPESIHEMIRRYVRSEQFAQKAQQAGVDTEEEANDFDIDDEEDPAEKFLTRHEIASMAAEEYKELQGEKTWRKLKESVKGADKNGSGKVAEGTSGAGRSGETSKAVDKSESGVDAGNRKEASGLAESGGK